MFKQRFAAAALGLIASGSYAQSHVMLYGLIDTGVTYANHVAAPAGGHGSVFRYGDGVSEGNRWGIFGEEDLGGGIEAIFTLENGFSTANGAILQGGALFGRQAWVGLEAKSVGSLKFGRQYSLSRDFLNEYTIAHQGLAGNYAYHINDLDQLVASRINNSVRFDLASFDGLRFGVLYGFSNQAGAFAGSPASTSDGGATQGTSRTWSAGLGYQLKDFSIGIAYTDIRFPGSATPPFSASVANVNTGPLRNLETFGIGGSYAMGNATVWGLWTHTRLIQIKGGQSTLNNYELGGRYKLTPAFCGGVGYTLSDLSGQLDGKWHQFNSFLDYVLSKRTEVYLLAIFQKASGSNVVDGTRVPVQAEVGSNPGFIGDSGVGANTQLVLRIGLLHKF